MKEYRRIATLALAGAVMGAAFFALSVRITKEEAPGAVSIALPQLQPLRDVLAAYESGGRPVVLAPAPERLVFGGPARLSAAENHWGFVRQSATWANGNSTMADELIVALKRTGLLSNTTAATIRTTTVIGGVSYKLLLETNNACAGTAGACTNISSTAYTGTKTYAHRLKMWRASDNKDALEMLFDDVNNPNTSNGVLLTYRLAVLNSALSDNENLIVESYISGGAPNRKQTYSWGQRFWNSGTNAATTTDAGRVVLEEMTIGLKNSGTAPGLCVRIGIRTVSQTITGCVPATPAVYYYALAYGQKTGTNFETTAQSGLFSGAMPDGATRTICSAGDLLKNGQFNGGGFVTDNVADASVSVGYPDPATGAGYNGVTTLFGNVGKTGLQAFEDTSNAKLNGLGAAIVFHPNAEVPTGF